MTLVEYNNAKQRIYRNILFKTKRALDKLGIPMFLSSGTCLGYYREGKIIEHDYDIDVGIHAKDFTTDIIGELAKEGLVHYRTLGNRSTGLELSFRLPGTVIGKRAKIDIFLHYPETINGIKYVSWYSYKAPEFTEKVQYRVKHFDIKEVDFMGIRVNVPKDTVKYLREHYGEDWMIPQRPFTEYVYHSSPKSVVK